jgi:phage baseplate assembly protein W
MPYSWTMPPEPGPPVGPPPSPLGGVDILFAAGNLVVSPSGDWATVEGLDAIRQSVLGEAQTGEGELVFRDEYGMGLAQVVKRALSQATLDERQQRLLERLAANDRVVTVREAKLERVTIDGRVGLRVTIRVAGRDGRDLTLSPIVIGGS